MYKKYIRVVYKFYIIYLFRVSSNISYSFDLPRGKVSKKK